jgi:hypothetical protein
VRGAPLPGMAGRALQQGCRCPETAQDALSTLPSHSGAKGPAAVSVTTALGNF